MIYAPAAPADGPRPHALINDIDDFRAIWQFLGWIDDSIRWAG